MGPSHQLGREEVRCPAPGSWGLDSQDPELVDVLSSGHQGTQTVQAPLGVDAAKCFCPIGCVTLGW